MWPRPELPETHTEMPSDRLKSALSTGWRRTLLITFFAQLLTAVGFSSIFPFLPLYVQSLGARSGLSIELLSGLVYSAQAATMMIASPIWGALADRYGRKLMVERSMFGGAILLLLMAFVRSAEELVLLRALQGLVTGTLAASNALVAATVPRERSGYAMGLLQVALGAGVSLGPLLGGSVADAWGYGAAFYVTAALLFLSGVTVLVGVEEAFVPVRDPSGGHAGFLARWRRVLSGPGVPLAYALRFMTQLGRMTILPVLPLFIPVLLKGATRVNTFTGLVVGASAGTAMLSAAYLGRLGDRVGHRRIVILSTLLAAVFYLPQSLVTEGWQLLVLQAMVGIAMGGFLPGISALLAGLTRSGDEGAVYGLDNSIRAAARSVAPLLGAGVALWFGLRTTFAAAAVLFFLTALLAAWRLPSGKDLPQPEPNKEPYPS